VGAGTETLAAGSVTDRRTRLVIGCVLFPFVVAQTPGVHATAAARIGALNQRVTRNHGCRCAVVAVPGGRADTLDS
jgi:hypothetical protein